MKSNQKVRKGIWYALLFSITSLYLIFRAVSGVPLQRSFAGINWIYLGLGFLILLLVWLSKAYRMYVIALGMKVPARLGKFLQIYLSTCFISHVTPFSSGGTPLQIYLLHKQGIVFGKATLITLVDLGLNLIVFFLLTVTVLIPNLSLIGSFKLFKVNYSAFFWISGFTVLGLLIFYLFYRRNRKNFQWFARVRNYLAGKGWLKHLRRELTLFKEGWLLLVKENPASILWATFSTVIYWFFYLWLVPLILWAIGRPGSYVNLILWQLFFNFIQILIPTPGGSGGSELVLTYLFKNLTGPAKIGTFVVLWKIYTFFSTLIIGGIVFMKLTRENGEGGLNLETNEANLSKKS